MISLEHKIESHLDKTKLYSLNIDKFNFFLKKNSKNKDLFLIKKIFNNIFGRYSRIYFRDKPKKLYIETLVNNNLFIEFLKNCYTPLNENITNVVFKKRYDAVDVYLFDEKYYILDGKHRCLIYILKDSNLKFNLYYPKMSLPSVTNCLN